MTNEELHALVDEMERTNTDPPGFELLTADEMRQVVVEEMRRARKHLAEAALLQRMQDDIFGGRADD